MVPLELCAHAALAKKREQAAIKAAAEQVRRNMEDLLAKDGQIVVLAISGTGSTHSQHTVNSCSFSTI
jgi:hypothetical protein